MRASERGEPMSAGRVFRVPMVLALLTAIGLLSALLGDDGWDVLSWLTLGTLIAVVGWAMMRRPG